MTTKNAPDILEIPLSQGKRAIVDTADYRWLSRWKWCFDGRYAARTDGNGRVVRMHRLIMNPPKNKVVDHINRNRLDNRRCNLRICSKSANMRNTGSNIGSSSKYKGVYRKGSKWGTTLLVDGAQKYFGTYPCEALAAHVINTHMIERDGRFAVLNEPICPVDNLLDSLSTDGV